MLKYNALAATSAVIGMANTFLTWRVLGVSHSADIWLLGLAVTNILSLLVLLGVEQYVVFYTDKLTTQPGEAIRFVSTAILWGGISGILFSLICYGIVNWLVIWFAGGLDDPSKQEAVSIFRLLLIQVAAAPLLYVARGTLNAHGKYGWAYVLQLIVPFVLFLALVSFINKGCDVDTLAWTVAMAACLQAAACILSIGKYYRLLEARVTKEFVLFVRNSITMRLGHSVHNLLVGMIVNNALSHYAVGAISIFQYAKRFTEGLYSLTVAPHASIYYSKQARAWFELDKPGLATNTREYIRVSIPLFVGASVVVLFVMPWFLGLMGKQDALAVVGAVQTTFIFLTLWQAVISLETVYTSIVITAQQSFFVIGINALFVANYFLCTRPLAPDSSVWPIAAIGFVAQLVSIICYRWSSFYLIRKRFSSY